MTGLYMDILSILRLYRCVCEGVCASTSDCVHNAEYNANEYNVAITPTKSSALPPAALLAFDGRTDGRTYVRMD